MDSLLWALVKDAINEGLLVTDLQFSILDINRNLEIMLELDNWKGKCVSEVFPKKVLQAIDEVIREIETNGVCLYPKRINFITSKGVMLPLLVSVDPIVGNEGEKLGYLFVFRDAIIQDEIGALSWMNNVKTAYISKVAKDFYLPFHNLDRDLDDYIEFYSEENEGKELLIDAQAELKKLRDVFERFLEYSRIDIVCEKVILQRVNVEKIVHQALLLVVTGHIQEKVFVEAEGDTGVVGDAFKLEQLFVSLIDQFDRWAREEDKLQINIRGQSDSVSVDISLSGRPIPDELRDLPAGGSEFLAWQETESLEKNFIRWILSKIGIKTQLLNWKGQEIFRLLIPKEL